MKLKENDVNILKIVIYNNNITISDISLYLSLSKSTVRNSIFRINKVFKSHNFNSATRFIMKSYDIL